MRKLIKIDKNGTKYYADDTCRRCGGLGERSEWYYTGRTCYECGGTGHSKVRIEKEYTDEFMQKLTERRAKKLAEKLAKEEEERKAHEAELRAEEERLEAERKAEEERIKAEKAVSQFVGEIGQKIEVEVIYIGSPYFTVRDPFGREETKYIHSFKDLNGNKIVWFTGCGLRLEENDHVVIRATVKDHKVYKDEKQTSVLRLKVISK